MSSPRKKDKRRSVDLAGLGVGGGGIGASGDLLRSPKAGSLVSLTASLDPEALREMINKHDSFRNSGHFADSPAKPAQKKTLSRKLSKEVMVSHEKVSEVLNDPYLTSSIELDSKDTLEMVLDSSPDSSTLVGLSKYKTKLLGLGGSNQPQILFSSLTYLLDYLLVPHHGKTSGVKASTKLSAVEAKLPEWVLSVWRSFMLSYKDFLKPEELLTELMTRFETAGTRQPGDRIERGTQKTYEQIAYETTESFVVVLHRDESSNVSEPTATRSAKAVLQWMGVSQSVDSTTNRQTRQSSSSQAGTDTISRTKIRLNVLLFLQFWLKNSVGALDVLGDADTMDTLKKFVKLIKSHGREQLPHGSEAPGDSGSFLQPSEDVASFELALSELDETMEAIKRSENNPERLAKRLEFDSDGSSMRAEMTKEDINIYEMSLCFKSFSVPSWFVKSIGLRQFTPTQVAHQLTLVLYDQAYRHIRPESLAYSKARKAHIHVANMVRFFKIFSWWPVTTILKEDVPVSNRLELLAFFVEVCEELRNVNNFHGLFGVFGGMTAPTMTWVWDRFKSEYPKYSKRVDALKRATSSSNDYRVHKADLSKCGMRSRIPFQGLTNKVLEALEDRIPTHNESHPLLINFGRCLSRQAVIEDFLLGQRFPYVSKTGQTFSNSSVAPGPSPYAYSEHGELNQKVYSSNASAAASTAVSGKTPGSIILVGDSDLNLLLGHSMSMTMGSDALVELSRKALIAAKEGT